MDVERRDVNIIVQSVVDCVEGNLIANKPFSPSIFMAPSTLRNLSPSSFKPRVVSIGPLHGKDENLQRFEVHKAIFVKRLLDRSVSKRKEAQTLTQVLTACVEKVTASMVKIKECYADIRSYDDLELAKLMVMDACFILEFIYHISELDYPGSKLMLLDNYIPYDLVLLENQIPFFVLNHIFQCTILQFEEQVSLTDFIHPLMKYPNLFQGQIKSGGSRLHTKYDHILGYLHQCYKPRTYIPSKFPSSTIHTVVELDRAGVIFKPHKVVEWPLAMKVHIHTWSTISWFLFNPSLRMATLRINHFTELVLRNLIAYEQLSTVRPYVTSYARAMDMLIDTHEDIAKLVSAKVIVNHLGSNEEAAHMINGICKEVLWEKFFYSEEWEKLDYHFNGYWPKKIVNLRRVYFNSPWNIIALFAGIALFALAVVQTIFSVKSAGK